MEVARRGEEGEGGAGVFCFNSVGGCESLERKRKR